MRRSLPLLLLAASCGGSGAPAGGSPDATPEVVASDAGIADTFALDEGTLLDASEAGDAPETGGFVCTPAPSPPVGAPLQGLTLSEGYTDPRALPAPVNIGGWDDSSYISADGTTLYFGYTQWDYYLLATGHGIVVDGPQRPGETSPQFQIFEATIQNGAWNVVASTVNSSDPNIAEAAEGVDDTQTTMAFIEFMSGASQGSDLFLSSKQGGSWGSPEMLPAPINTPCVEDNAAITGDGAHVFFDSNRLDPLGQSCNSSTSSTVRTIYESSLVGGSWSAPVPVPGAPNQGDWHWQGYARTLSDFYWAGHDAGCGASVDCIYHARLQSDGSYGAPSILIQPAAQASAQVGDVYAVGEVSITCDGKYVYFAYIVKTVSGAQIEIGVAHR